MKIAISFIAILLLFTSPAWADCSSPDGVESQTRYDFAAHKMFYCNGTQWVESGGGGGAVSCRVVSAANGVSCDASEFVTGGGCSSSTSLTRVNPSGNGYTCSNASGSKTAYAICCTNTGGGDPLANLIVVLTQGNTAGGQKITGLGTPTAGTDAAHKNYVDGKFGALTNNKWCRTDGTAIICDQDAPGGGDTLANLSCTPGQIVIRGATAWECSNAPCPGVVQDGYCWVLGASGASCTSACTSAGARTCDASATLGIGSGGSNSQCNAVLTALGAPGSSTSGYPNSTPIGCVYAGSRYRYSGGTTTCAGNLASAQRACACSL